MQCPRCHFENLPGLSACMRCGAVLLATVPVNVHPPRAGWTRLFRPLRYAINHLVEASPFAAWGERIDRFLSRWLFGNENLLWAFLSIAPGLGHWLSGRLRRVLWHCTGWLVCLVVGLLFWGVPIGTVALGLAIGLHSWVVIDAGRIRELAGSFRTRLILVACVFLVFVRFVYGGVQRHIADIARPGIDIPPYNVTADDFLLFWKPGPLQRGDLVLYRVRSSGDLPFVNRHEGIVVRGGLVVGRLLAFPGEEVTARSGRLAVRTSGGQALDFDLPLPLDFALTVPAKNCLCYPIGLRVQNNMLNNVDIIRRVALPRLGEVRGRAVMIYNTFFHRAPLARLPLDPARPPDS